MLICIHHPNGNRKIIQLKIQKKLLTSQSHIISMNNELFRFSPLFSNLIFKLIEYYFIPGITILFYLSFNLRIFYLISIAVQINEYRKE